METNGETDGSGATESKPQTVPAAAATASLGTLLVFTLTTFLSATLLFSVQPMFAKMALPLLGGSPSVWAVALCFFQGALLAGYCYAHLLISRVALLYGGLAHLGLCLLAFTALPIALPERWGDPPTSEPYVWQLGLFTAAIGLPFVAVAANAPLLQAWFARSGHSDAHDPYFLYAASNLGSLIALLGYPLVLEPVFGLTALSAMWTYGFAALVALLACCMYLAQQGKPLPETTGVDASRFDETDVQATAAGSATPVWSNRLAWIGLSFVPSALLTAFTTHVATDVASAPLIWVIPLALYLLTFVVVFRERALVPQRVLLVLHLVAVVLALLQLSQTRHDNWFISSSIGVAAFFLSGLVAHRTLYEARPAARHLTEFYLWMSFGGVLGGLFAALIAPQLFSEVFEYPLLLALTFACRPGAVRFAGLDHKEIGWLLAILVAAAIGVWWVPWAASKLALDFGRWGVTPFIAAAFAVLMLLFWRWPMRQLAVALTMFASVVLLPSSVHRGDAQRSYFGVYRVLLSEDGEYNVLQHGTTLHGAQRVRDADGQPITDPTPATYYYPGSPMSTAVKIARRAVTASGGKGLYGVIGLGAGALACYSLPDETWRFFEIDPIVIDIAKSPKFTYLASCQPQAEMVVGDARLTLSKDKDASYDFLIVDAFSSDAIPMHLLTREAMELYLAKLKPEGIGVLHISNRYLNLEAVVAATIYSMKGVKAFVLQDKSGDAGYAKTESTIVAFSRDMAAAHQFMGVRGSRTFDDEGLRPWTDDSSDIVGPFLAKFGKWR